MSKIDELIAKYCPDGVEYKELHELGYLYGGLTGKNKSDFEKGNAKYITYKNIYSNISIDINIENYVSILENEKQNKVKIGDVLFTGSSENSEDCGMSSELTELSQEDLYLNSFSFGFRLNDCSLFISGFLKYLFRDSAIRKQIIKTASGVTRINISKKRFEKIQIPIPPLPVQEEIVKILDKFTSLEAELEAELEARKQQYEFYRNQLLSFDGKDVEWKTLGDIGVLSNTGVDKKTLENENKIKLLNFVDVFHNQYLDNNSPKMVVTASDKKIIDCNILRGDIFITPSSELIDEIGQSAMAIENIEDTVYSYHIMRLRLYDKNKINPAFINYLFSSKELKKQIRLKAQGITRFGLTKPNWESLSIPIPPLPTQEEIVKILDQFDALVNDIATGLPAEIQARKQQYEYYRGKLLTFQAKEMC